MAVFLSPIGNGFQFFDANGKPLNAGLLNTYAAGSTTPTNTYTTSLGNVANANPIVLNTDGRTPSEIWLTGGTAYKFVLTDSLSNTLGTYDNLYGIGDPASPPVANQYFNLTTVVGTNTITAASSQALSALATGQLFVIVPVGTNTTAVTINITPSGSTALGAKNVLLNGLALGGGEMRLGVPLILEYDGSSLQIVGNGATTYNIVGYKNLVINATCQVTTRGDLGISTSLSTSRAIGGVDRIGVWASSGVVGAGTITAGTDIGVASVAAKAAGATLTGAGVISASYRMRAADAVKYKNTTMSFSVTVSHDVGSNVNYTLVALKPTVSDNYGSRTTISTGSATAVSTGIGTGTRLTFNGVSVGDVSNGLELEVQAACGAVTTKNMEFTDWQFELGGSATAFERHRYEDDVQECAVYLPFFKSFSTAEYLGASQSNSNNQQTAFYAYKVRPRIVPTGVTVSSAAHFRGTDATPTAQALNTVTFGTSSLDVCSLVLAATGTPWTAGQAGGFIAVSASGYLLFTGAEL